MIETSTLRAPKKLKDELRADAKTKGITLNALLLSILWHYVEQQKGER